MIKVMVVDDQQLVRAGFTAILEGEPDIEVVGEAADGVDVLSVARDCRPDVVLMDIRMPGLDGIAATRQLMDEGPGGPHVLMLTTFDLDEYLYEAMKAGAGGFLLKDVPRAQLLAAVRSVAAGEASLAPSLVRRLVDDFVGRPLAGRAVDERLASLTTRETEVLMQMAKGQSNAEVAAALFLSEATVRTHVTHIFEKLRVRDRVQAVVLAYQSGIVGAD